MIALTSDQFGAVGNGTTNDQPALETMLATNGALVAAGKGGSCKIDARPHLVTMPGSETGCLYPPSGTSMCGEGSQSVLKTTSNGILLKLLHCEDSLFSNFAIAGSNAGASQDGFESGYLGNDGSSRMALIGLYAHDFGGRGFSLAYGTNAVPGPIVIACRANDNASMGFGAYQQGTYLGCVGKGNGIGLNVASGNVIFCGGDLTANATGLKIIGGGNDAHGIVCATQINHCTSYGIDVGAMINGHTFAACNVYQSPMRFVGNTGTAHFADCFLDPATYEFNDSIVKFSNCIFPMGYENDVTESNDPDTEFVSCRDVQGNIPPFVGNRVRCDLPLSSDADVSLTRQQSRAETLVIPAGTWTTTRKIVYTTPPSKGEVRYVENHNVHDAYVYFATGTGVTLSAGKGMRLSGDGTNAVGVEGDFATIVAR